jgi:hypothetical protein
MVFHLNSMDMCEKLCTATTVQEEGGILEGQALQVQGKYGQARVQEGPLYLRGESPHWLSCAGGKRDVRSFGAESSVKAELARQTHFCMVVVLASHCSRELTLGCWKVLHLRVPSLQ